MQPLTWWALALATSRCCWQHSRLWTTSGNSLRPQGPGLSQLVDTVMLPSVVSSVPQPDSVLHSIMNAPEPGTWRTSSVDRERVEHLHSR